MSKDLLGSRTFFVFGGGVLIAFVLVVFALTALAPGAEAGTKPPKDCVPTDGLSLEPTRIAPAWYQPGKTHFCPSGDTAPPVFEIDTAYWVYYESPPGYPKYRTTPDNADYSANDCVASYTTCGTKIISDANDFYNTCHNVYGLSASQVATNIRYWADRARANGTNWRVYTLFEGGGYPYRCEFSVVAL